MLLSLQFKYIPYNLFKSFIKPIIDKCMWLLIILLMIYLIVITVLPYTGHIFITIGTLIPKASIAINTSKNIQTSQVLSKPTHSTQLSVLMTKH